MSPSSKLPRAAALLLLGIAPMSVGIAITEKAGLPLPLAAGVAGGLAGMLMVGAIWRISERHRWRRVGIGSAFLTLGATLGVLGWMQPLLTREKAVALPRFRVAAEVFFRDHPERIFVHYDELVGPTRFLKGDAGWREDYRSEFPLRADLRDLGVTMETGHRVVLLADAEGNYQAFVRHRRDGAIVNIGSGRLAEEGLENYRQFLAGRPRDGVEVRLLHSGARFETTYRDGRPEGAFRVYYADGKPWAEATYAAGRPKGRHVIYNRGGAVIYETTF